MDTQVKKKLFNTHCLSLYGSQLWDLDNKKIERLCVEWRKCCRRVLGLSPRTHCRLIPPLMNTQPIQTIVHQRLLNFIISGLCHDNAKLKYIFMNVFIGNFSHFTLDINKILRNYNLNYLSIFNGKKVFLKPESELMNWEVSVLNDILHMRDYNLYDYFNKSQINSIIDFICVF